MAFTQMSLLEIARQEDPGRSDDQLVRQIATKTIRELAEQPPVDLNVVAAYRGIDDIRLEALDTAGSLTPQEKGLVMRIRKGDSRPRQRFTGFHEVAHTFQPGFWEERLFRCDARGLPSQNSVDKEALSDIGAAELLMPEEFFREDLKQADFGLNTALELASKYEASVQASCYRLSQLWPEPTLVVVLEPGLRRNERTDPSAKERLRVLHAHHAGGHWPFIPRNKSAADDGPLVRALAAEGQEITEAASLDDLVSEGPPHLEVSARAFGHRTATGALCQRVLAIFRQTTT